MPPPEDAEALAEPTRKRNGIRLRAILRLAEPALAAASGRFWRDQQLAARFPTYMLRVLTSARAALGVMAAAQRRSEALAPDDPVAARLAVYYAHHLEEETGHPGWLVADLESIGVPREVSSAAVGSPAIAAMAGAQYYWIEHAHPVAALGLFAVLEGYPPSTGDLDRIRARTDLPASAFRFLRAHAEIDPHHAADLYRLLDELPLTPEQEGLVGTSALHTVGALGAVFDELLARPAAAVPAVG